MSAPFEISPGSVVHVDPPTVPALAMAPPVSTTVLVLPVAGPQGPQGVPGTAGDATLQHLHTQSTPQAVVTVVHNLGRRPASVTLFSLDFAQNFDAYQITHIDTTSLRISIDTPTAYVALIQ